jgi:hypothetical protein
MLYYAACVLSTHGPFLFPFRNVLSFARVHPYNNHSVYILLLCVHVIYSVPFRATRVARTHKTHTHATAPLLFLVTISTEMVDTHTHI